MNIKRIGQIEGTKAILAYNRTGAQRLKGDIVMLDVLQSATETTGIVEGNEASVFANVVLPATAGLPLFPFYVCAEDIDDNAFGLMIACGVAEARCKDDDAATTDIDAGDGVTVLNGDHDLEAVTAGNRIMGCSLEDAAASGSAGDSALKSVMWWGGAWGSGTISA